VAQKLAEQLSKMYAGLYVAGTYCPPFRSLNEEEDKSVVDKINSTEPDIVWIGYGVIILSGVRIGRGYVVAAGSVVTCDVPEHSIVAGNPAKPVKRRFTQEQIKEHEILWKSNAQ